MGLLDKNTITDGCSIDKGYRISPSKVIIYLPKVVINEHFPKTDQLTHNMVIYAICHKLSHVWGGGQARILKAAIPQIRHSVH